MTIIWFTSKDLLSLGNLENAQMSILNYISLPYALFCLEKFCRYKLGLVLRTHLLVDVQNTHLKCEPSKDPTDKGFT